VKQYNDEVLPRAINADGKLIDAMQQIVSDATAAKYVEAAASAPSPERRRYCLDIARELLYLDVRDLLQKRQAKDPYATDGVDEKRFRDPAPGAVTQGYTLGNSLAFWSSVRLLHSMDQAYGDGKFDRVGQMLTRVDRDGGVHDKAR
jgi:hypothetical protein